MNNISIINMEKITEGNIRKESDKAFFEKEDNPLKKTDKSNLQIFFGEPEVFVKDVSGKLTNNSDSNLFVAGEDENLSIRIMSSSVISIAKQSQESKNKFYCFNFIDSNSDLSNYTDELFTILNVESKIVRNSELKDVLTTIKGEIETRMSGIDSNHSKIFLAIYSFQRAYIFRKKDYESSDEGKLLEFILKEGSLTGVFCLLNVDSIKNFGKNLSNSFLDEFSLRIISQMNPDSSATIIGNSKGAELGTNRAYFYDYNQNTSINFIPYEIPNLNWVAQLQGKSSTLS